MLHVHQYVQKRQGYTHKKVKRLISIAVLDLGRTTLHIYNSTKTKQKKITVLIHIPYRVL